MSLGRKLGAMLLAAALGTLAAGAADQSTAPSKKTAAKAQLLHANELRTNLEAEPQQDRTKPEYEAAITAYRHVVSASPATAEAQAALIGEAELYAQMGRIFDDTYSQKAVDTYQFLLKQYPGTRYRADSMFAIARIQQDDLGSLDDAQKSFDDFLSKYPHSSRASDAQDALKEIAAKREQTARAAQQKSAPADHPGSGRMCRVTAIRQWNADNYTRVVISLDDEVKYQAARIANPDRIYFDLYTAHLSSSLAAKTIEVQNGFLKSVRVAQNQAGVVRVVLEVEKVREYSVFLLRDPYRLVVDVYGDAPANNTTAKAVTPPANEKQDAPDKNAVAAKTDKSSSASARTAKNADASAKKPAADTGQAAGAQADPPSEKASKPVSAKAAPPADSTDKSGAQVAASKPAKGAAKPGGPSTAPSATGAGTSPPSARTEVAENGAAPDEDADASDDSHPAPTKPRSGSAAVAPEAASVPQPTHRGDRSLTRTLGLKIGKIVIDAGHGGHDTGTIGPTGLEEKDLTLDVALRLGKLIEQKLGAEVVYTRSDDTFIPLEERTAIANQAKADLFVSIHANSSNDPAARGIETYYLNLTDSAEAREVAARENALSQASIHDLQDLVQKIARNEKIDESRELATEVQAGLTKRMQRASHAQKNRGVKRAPFVVLLGANMPSILTEISFISNPSDEAALKKGDQRQRVAEGILAGITRYLDSLGSTPHVTALLATRPSTGDR